MSSKKTKGKKPPATGICALLGTEGVYAKSHLIPLALTSPGEKGIKLIEAGRGSRPIRRPTGWYDYKLCTHEGELALRDVDTKGIEVLRKHKLIWGSWKPKAMNYHGDDLQPSPTSSDISYRLIDIPEEEANSLKIFLLSIIWRFLKSTREEFSYLENIGLDLNEIAEHIVSKSAPAMDTYPICLHQFITRGVPHNHSPTIQEMNLEINGSTQSIPYYRIYFDGLVAHLYMRLEPRLVESASYDDNPKASIYVADREKLVVFTRDFYESKQHHDMAREIIETTQFWPKESERVGGDKE